MGLGAGWLCVWFGLRVGGVIFDRHVWPIFSVFLGDIGWWCFFCIMEMGASMHMEALWDSFRINVGIGFASGYNMYLDSISFAV